MSKVERCNYLVDRFEIVRCSHFTVPKGENLSRECLRPANHKGPHLILTVHGNLVAWEKNLCSPGTCEGCDSEDPEDNCLVFWEVGLIEARKLVASGDYGGEQ